MKTVILESIKDKDGKISSNKITAFWFVVLITSIVFTFVVIAYLAVFKQVSISDGVFRLMELLGSTIILYLLAAICLLYGVKGWEMISGMRIKNPLPPSEINIEKQNIEKANIQTDGNQEQN